jgi:hypothetical protein
VTRRPKLRSRKTADTVENHVPPGLRARLEAARLDLLALFRALDSLLLAQHKPPDLRAIFELDADLAEALAVLDHQPQGYNLALMVRDTLASLDEIPVALRRFIATIPAADRDRLAIRIKVVRATLDPGEAYNQIPRSDPHLR